MVVRYDRATGCTGGPKPGAIALRDHWRAVTGLTDLGIYNCRRVRGGTSYSIHSEGRAVDLAADAHTPQQADQAERYCHFLIEFSEQLQVQYLIWNRRKWRSGQGWSTYNGVSPHTDHIHVELNRTGAAIVTPELLARFWTGRTQEDNDLYGTLIHASYVEAYGGDLPKKAGHDIVAWTLDTYNKVESERMPSVNHIRHLLGLHPL